MPRSPPVVEYVVVGQIRLVPDVEKDRTPPVVAEFGMAHTPPVADVGMNHTPPGAADTGLNCAPHVLVDTAKDRTPPVVGDAV